MFLIKVITFFPQVMHIEYKLQDVFQTCPGCHFYYTQPPYSISLKIIGFNVLAAAQIKLSVLFIAAVLELVLA